MPQNLKDVLFKTLFHLLPGSEKKGWELVHNPGHTPLLVVSSEMFVCRACFENMQKSSRVLMLSLSVLDFGEEESNKGSKERAQGTQSSG